MNIQLGSELKSGRKKHAEDVARDFLTGNPNLIKMLEQKVRRERAAPLFRATKGPSLWQLRTLHIDVISFRNRKRHVGAGGWHAKGRAGTQLEIFGYFPIR